MQTALSRSNWQVFKVTGFILLLLLFFTSFIVEDMLKCCMVSVVCTAFCGLAANHLHEPNFHPADLKPVSAVMFGSWYSTTSGYLSACHSFAIYSPFTECRVLSLSDCKYSLNPLSQTWIDRVGRYRIRCTFKLSYTWRVRVVIIGVLLHIKYILTNN